MDDNFNNSVNDKILHLIKHANKNLERCEEKYRFSLDKNGQIKKINISYDYED